MLVRCPITPCDYPPACAILFTDKYVVLTNAIRRAAVREGGVSLGIRGPNQGPLYIIVLSYWGVWGGGPLIGCPRDINLSDSGCNFIQSGLEETFRKQRNAKQRNAKRSNAKQRQATGQNLLRIKTWYGLRRFRNRFVTMPQVRGPQAVLAWTHPLIINYDVGIYMHYIYIYIYTYIHIWSMILVTPRFHICLRGYFITSRI